MGYFDRVLPPPEINCRPIYSSDQFIELITRIEKRAMEVVDPTLREMAGRILIDPYRDQSPGDSSVWLELFIATEKNRELYARLFFIRGGGTKLFRNQQWGFIFQPVIGPSSWMSVEEYNREKQCLDGYRDEMIDLLKSLARKKYEKGW